MCIAVKKNLQARGIQGNICCARCGAPEESINHVFFECPPAIQVWALSKIPSNPAIFPANSLFTNMDHLFWCVLPQIEDHQFAWILWYIWKERNNKVFSNFDMDPRDTLKLAETESTLWGEAQLLNIQRVTPTTQVAIVPSIPGRWCFTDGSWKEHDCLSGQGWYITLESFDGLMGARNIRACLSCLSFLSSCRGESFSLGNGVHAEFTSNIYHICNRLFSIGEDGFETRRMISFYKLFGRYQDS